MTDPDHAPPVEVEIKLIGAVRVLERAFAALDGGDGRGETGSLVSVYFDTPDDRLWRKGYSLRLRRRRGGHELTLKTEGEDQFVRGEWRALIDRPIADPGLLPRDAPRDRLGLILPEELCERHRTEVVRTKKRLQLGDAVIEAALDKGRICASGAVTPVAELELELLQGDRDAVFALAEELLGARALSLEFRSKAGRGLALAHAAPPPWRKSFRPVLTPDDGVDAAMARILGVSARQVLSNMAAAADGRDTEGVHQLRVALRRLRSALAIFGKLLGPEVGDYDAEAARALRALGPARDIDVFIDETLPPLLTGPLAGQSGAPGLDRLAELAAAERLRAYGEVRALVATPDFSRFIIRLLRLSVRLAARGGKPRPIRPFADSILRHRRRKAITRGKGFETMTTAERHKVRIAIKKLRYAVDFFQSLYPARIATPFQTRLKILQDDFGVMNDAAVAETLSARLVGDGDSAGADMGAALVRGWYAHRLETVEPHMVAAWGEFRNAAPFWRK